MPKVTISGATEQFTYASPFSFSHADAKDQSRLLMLAMRWRSVNLSLSRLKVEKAFLDQELDDLGHAASTSTDQAAAGAQARSCFFCQSSISAMARVCRECLRVQPDAYRDVIAKDQEVNRAIADARPEDFDPLAANAKACAYCLSSLSGKAMVCATCQRFQPRHLTALFREELRARQLMKDAGEG